MDIAYEKAKDSLAYNEVPVGALIVIENEIIASGHNIQKVSLLLANKKAIH